MPTSRACRATSFESSCSCSEITSNRDAAALDTYCIHVLVVSSSHILHGGAGAAGCGVTRVRARVRRVPRAAKKRCARVCAVRAPPLARGPGRQHGVQNVREVRVALRRARATLLGRLFGAAVLERQRRVILHERLGPVRRHGRFSSLQLLLYQLLAVALRPAAMFPLSATALRPESDSSPASLSCPECPYYPRDRGVHHVHTHKG